MKDLRFNILVKENFDRAMGVGARALRRFQGIAGGVVRGIKATFRGLFDFRTILAGGGLAGGIGLSIKKAFDLETVRVQFKVLIGDMATAKQLLKELKAESDATPFEFNDYANGARSLLAFGFAAEDVTGELRNLGDIAAGIGIPLGELTEIYGKARVQGRLFAEDINQLTGRGIPVITELAKVFNVTEGEVKDLVAEGKVGFGELQQVIRNLTGEGGQFKGMMSELSATGNGLISTLKGEWTGALQDFGAAFMDLSKNALEDLIDRIKTLRKDGTIEEWAEKGAKAARILADVMGDIFSGDQEERAKALGDMGRVVNAMFMDAGTAFLNVVGPGLVKIFNQLPGVKQVVGASERLGVQTVVTKQMQKEGSLPRFGIPTKEQQAEYERRVQEHLDAMERGVTFEGIGPSSELAKALQSLRYRAEKPDTRRGSKDRETEGQPGDAGFNAGDMSDSAWGGVVLSGERPGEDRSKDDPLPERNRSSRLIERILRNLDEDRQNRRDRKAQNRRGAVPVWEESIDMTSKPGLINRRLSLGEYAEMQQERFNIGRMESKKDRQMAEPTGSKTKPFYVIAENLETE